MLFPRKLSDVRVLLTCEKGKSEDEDQKQVTGGGVTKDSTQESQLKTVKFLVLGCEQGAMEYNA
jgi:hypothetical protein